MPKGTQPLLPRCEIHPTNMKSAPLDTPSRLAPFFAWCVAFWITLAGVIFGLMHSMVNEPVWWWLVLFALMVAVLNGAGVLRASRAAPRVARVSAWAISLAGLVVVALGLDGQRAAAHGDPFFSWLLALSMILPVLVVVGLWIRATRSGLKAASWRADCAIATLCLVCIPGSGYHLFQLFFVAPAVWNAEMKWSYWPAHGRV